MGNIYESLALVVLLRLGFITAGAVQDMGLLSPPITWNRQAFLYWPSVVFPMGAVSIFLVNLISCSVFFFYIGFQTQHNAIVLVHLNREYRLSGSVLRLRI